MKHYIIIFVLLAILGLSTFLGINVLITSSTKENIYTVQDSPSAYVGIVFGAAVYGDGRLSDVLKDRAKTAIELYNQESIQKILVSGDNGTHHYNEVEPTRDYLVSQGIPKNDIVLDYAGFDTYDTLYRARDVFLVEDAILITQEFHLPRAVFICQKLGMQCSGAIADKQPYIHADNYKKRESLARIKAFLEILFHTKPKFLGETIKI